ncbi:DNA-binding protein Alba [Candidatus Parvarchaeota archaeon]|nr:DNA-binding protein Alba [Candidatus Parvarchaeota archaeon]
MEDDVIFIGKKPLMSYILAILTHMNSGHSRIVIKARGSMISKAVDVSQIVKRKFSKDLKVTKVEIGTEELPGREEDHKTRDVSYISIEMAG